MGSIDREKPQNEVIGDERRDLARLTRHGNGSSVSNRWILLAAGEAVALGFLLLPDARRSLLLYLLLFLAGSLVSLRAARSLSASGLGFLLLCGGLFRVTLLLRSPDLSEDVHRYLWDGRVARAGVSPYAYPPDDPAVSAIAPGFLPPLAHRDIRSVYPPAAQAVFRVFSGGGIVCLKAVFAAADLSVVALLAGAGGPGTAFGAALYAFHPLPITETAGQGHLDSLGVALLLASLSHLTRNRRAVAGVALAMSVLTKYISLAGAIPIFRRGRAAFSISFALWTACLWLAASGPGASPAGGIGQYATRWSFNSPLYAATVRLMEASDLPQKSKAEFLALKERLHHPAWTQTVFPFFYSAFFARVLLALVLAAVLVLIAWRVAGLEESVFASLAALLLVSPTLHPWYLLWVLPFAAKKREPAFLYLSFSVPLAYALLYPIHPIPRVWPPLVLVLEFVPFGVLLSRSLWLSRRVRLRAAEAPA